MPGKKGYPRFQRHCRSVEYKVTGLEAGRQMDATSPSPMDMASGGCGCWELAASRRSRRSRSNGCGWCGGQMATTSSSACRPSARCSIQSTGKQVGIDVGLASFTTDSEGEFTPNPRYLRQAETKLKRLHRRVSRKQKGSKNREKARQRLARAYLQVSRQREDHARKLAGTLISSCDWIAYEHLQIRNMVKNRHLAKSISDASWARFLWWVEHYAKAAGIVAVGGAAPVDQPATVRGAGSVVQKSSQCAHPSLSSLWAGTRP